MLTFSEKLQNKWVEKKFVCVGLDPVLEKIPRHFQENFTTNYDVIYEFLKRIVDSTADLVCAYKPNVAFFEQYGIEGEKALISLIEYMHSSYSDIPVIGDFKRGDIGNTNMAYAKAAFEVYKVDAITVNPYLGQEALKPFLEYTDKGIIILVKTSNPGAGEFQDLKLENGKLLYEEVAEHIVQDWNKNGNCAVVVGATYPQELKNVREIIGNMPMLIPGIGTQGGNLEEILKYAPDSNDQGMIINSGSSIIYASNGEDFGEAAKNATLKLHQEIVSYLK